MHLKAIKRKGEEDSSMKRSRILACCMLGLCALTGFGSDGTVLHIYTWSDYIAKDVVARFEKENGCKVAIATFDSNEAMFAKLQKDGTSGYDIIMPSSYQIPAMIENGMVQPLDHAKLPNVRRNFDATYGVSILDPSFMYNVPYAVTYSGIAYRKDKVGNAPIDSWNVFGTAALKGRMSLLSDMRETLGAGLMALGYSIISTRKEQIAAAADKVIEWKRNIAKFDNERYKEAVASGEWAVGHGYSSDVIQVMLKGDDIGFALPKEGFTIAFDEIVIAAGSKNVDLAHKFINFCYDPDVAAANMAEVCSLMPVGAAISKLDGRLRKLVELDAHTLRRGEVIRDFYDRPEIGKMYSDAWDRVMVAE